MMTYPQLNFIEWLQLDEAKSRTFVAKKPKVKKPKAVPTVHHDLDSWLGHVDNLKKELELLKDKLKDKKKPDVTKPEEPKKTLIKKPEEKEDDSDQDKAGDKEKSKASRDSGNNGKEDDKDKDDRVLSPVAGDRLDFRRRPLSKPPLSTDRSNGRKPNSKDAADISSR